MKLLICLMLFICVGCSPTEKTIVIKKDYEPLHIIMSTDFHLQQTNLETQSTLVKEMKYNVLIIKSFMNTVIESKPDVLLLCGDNTNNGIYADHALLVSELTKVKDAGIDVIVVPGNHDLYQVTRDEYIKLYQPLLDDIAIYQDTASLSYVAKMQDSLWFLVLDDLVNDTSGGSFTDETLAWMEEVLNKAEQEGITVLAATHHNLLSSSQEKYVSTYKIDRPEALKLLKEYGVFVNFSGHRHTMQTAIEDNFIEIVGSMLITYPGSYHSINLDQTTLTSKTLPLSIDSEVSITELQDFKTYLLNNKKDSIQYTMDLCLNELNLTNQEISYMHKVYELVSTNYSKGTLADIQSIALKLPGYSLWQTKAPDTTWAPWLQYLVEVKRGNDSNIIFKIPTIR